jgi:UDP-N-acetylglucosamine 2-epimerase (non-hydrolysing)
MAKIMKISLILGTRPEIIKMAPIIRECELRNLDYFILHTGQHYSYNMDAVFFEQLELPKPKYNLGVGSGLHGEQTGKMLLGIEKILLQEKPDIVLVQGDTNTTLSGALAAAKLHIKVAHIEAGLRSFDKSMPEEINRIIVDHLSDYLFAPTENSKNLLISEGIPIEKIFVTGNTVVDTLVQNLEISKKKSNPLKDFGLEARKYILVTVHRQENVDNPKRFGRILEGISLVSREFEIPLVYPVHPRSRKMMERFGLKTDGLKLTDPIDYLSFIQLEANACLIMTDSGGVQEEACVLKVPCVTLRDNTERPETIEVGANMLAGTDPEKILECSKIMLNRRRNWKNPFGDGKAGKRIVEIIIESPKHNTKSVEEERT